MDSDKNNVFRVPDVPAKNVKSSNVCKVCEINTSVMYLGIRCCSSCKVFFYRNANLDLNTPCVFDGNCQVTVNSRGTCRYCRLKKCFGVGLAKDLIRAHHSSQHLHQKEKKTTKLTITSNEMTCSLPDVIPTLDLLINDRSLLSLNQWSLLSNVTHAYDDQSPASTIRNNMTLQLAYPSKMQLKQAMNYFKVLTGALYLSAGPFMKTMPEFMNMSINDRRALVERNIRSLSGFGGILVLRETNICRSPFYHNASVVTYGHQRTNEAIRIIGHADTDGTLIKLMVPILALSTCSDIIDPDVNITTGSTTTPGGTRFFSNTLDLFRCQNVYVEMLFKYMLYRYGYNETALRFASLIKSSLDQNILVSGDGDLKIHDQMVRTIIDDTERSFTVLDEISQ